MVSNIFEATCCRCGKPVAPGAGLCSGKIGNNWRVVHTSCIPVMDAKKYHKLEYDL